MSVHAKLPVPQTQTQHNTPPSPKNPKPIYTLVYGASVIGVLSAALRPDSILFYELAHYGVMSTQEDKVRIATYIILILLK